MTNRNAHGHWPRLAALALALPAAALFMVEPGAPANADEDERPDRQLSQTIPARPGVLTLEIRGDRAAIYDIDVIESPTTTLECQNGTTFVVTTGTPSGSCAVTNIIIDGVAQNMAVRCRDGENSSIAICATSEDTGGCESSTGAASCNQTHKKPGKNSTQNTKPGSRNTVKVRSEAEKRHETQRKDLTKNWAG